VEVTASIAAAGNIVDPEIDELRSVEGGNDRQVVSRGTGGIEFGGAGRNHGQKHVLEVWRVPAFVEAAEVDRVEGIQQCPRGVVGTEIRQQRDGKGCELVARSGWVWSGVGIVDAEVVGIGCQ